MSWGPRAPQPFTCKFSAALPFPAAAWSRVMGFFRPESHQRVEQGCWGAAWHGAGAGPAWEATARHTWLPSTPASEFCHTVFPAADPGQGLTCRRAKGTLSPRPLSTPPPVPLTLSSGPTDNIPRAGVGLPAGGQESPLPGLQAPPAALACCSGKSVVGADQGREGTEEVLGAGVTLSS